MQSNVWQLWVRKLTYSTRSLRIRKIKRSSGWAMKEKEGCIIKRKLDSFVRNWGYHVTEKFCSCISIKSLYICSREREKRIKNIFLWRLTDEFVNLVIAKQKFCFNFNKTFLTLSLHHSHFSWFIPYESNEITKVNWNFLLLKFAWRENKYIYFYPGEICKYSSSSFLDFFLFLLSFLHA